MFSPQDATEIGVAEDYIGAYITKIAPDVSEPTDLANATKLVYVIRTLEGKLWEEEESARKLVEEIKAHLLHKTTQIEERIGFLHGLLKPFAQFQLEGKKERSIDTVPGRFGFRKTSDRVEVKDEASFYGWCKDTDQPSLIITTIRPAVAKIKESLKVGGVVPDGCEVIPGEERFFVKTKRGGEEDGK